MSDKETVIAAIHKAFETTEHPGDAFLQGSHEGCEPAEEVGPVRGRHDVEEEVKAITSIFPSARSFFNFFDPPFGLTVR